MLRSGSNAAQTGNAQIAFGYDETDTYKHRIGTRHEPTVQAGNAIDFYVWKRATDTTLQLGSQHVLTLDATGSSLTGPLTLSDGISGGLKLNDGVLDLSSASGITFPSGVLDLSAVAATATAVGTGSGDKIALYSNQYGFGIGSARLVAYVATGAGFSVRTSSGTGAKSSGADAITLMADGTAQFTALVSGAAAAASAGNGFRPGASGANAVHLEQQSGGSILSGLYAGHYILSDNTYRASATATGIGIRAVEFQNGLLAMGGGIVFKADKQDTTAATAVTPVERMRITGDGQVRIPGPGTTPTVNATPPGLRIGSSYGLTIEQSYSANQDGFIGHNMYVEPGSTFYGTLGSKWDTAHASFGSRAIGFHYGTGIDFYADTVATTAGTAFTPTLRMRITNAGQVQIPLSGSTGGLLIGGDTNLYRASANLLMTDDDFRINGVANALTLVDPNSVVVGGLGRFLRTDNSKEWRFGWRNSGGGISDNLWWTYNDTVAGWVTSIGMIGGANAGISFGTDATLYRDTTSGTALRSSVPIGADKFQVLNSGSIEFWSVLPGSTSVGTIKRDLSASGAAVMLIQAAQSRPVLVRSSEASTIPLSIEALAGQTTLLTQWMDSTATVKARVESDGSIGTYNIFKLMGATSRIDAISQTSGTTIFTTRATGEANNRLIINNLGVMQWGDGAVTGDTTLKRDVQHTLAGLYTEQAIRVARVSVGNQHVQITPGDAGANYLDSWTSEANKKHLIFRTLHGSEGAPSGSHGFDWQVGPSSAPLTIMALTDAGALNVQGASAGYSISGVPLRSTHLSDYANIAMLNENETVTVGWNWQGSQTYRPAGTTFPYMSLTMGTTQYPAYFGWFNTLGARKAYIGWGADTEISMVVEAGAKFNFSSLALVTSAVENSTATFSSGAHTFTANQTNQRMVTFNAPTYHGDLAGRTMTNAATVAITGAPVAGTNMTLPQTWSLYVQGGATRLDGLLYLPNAATASTGIQFGADTVLYRSTTDTLNTDDRLIITRPLAADNAFTIRAGAANQLNITANGTMSWADAAGTLDISLFRDNAPRLTTPDLRATRFAVGMVPASVYLPFRNYQTWTDDVSSTRYGFYNQAYTHPVTLGLNDTNYGLLNELRSHDDLATGNITGTQIALSSIFYQINTAAVPRDFSTVEGIRSTLSYTGTGPYGNITSAIMFRATSNTPTTGIWASRYGMYLDPPTVSAGSAITNNYGIRIFNQGNSSVGNATGIYIDDTSGATSTNRSIYVLAGQVRIGSVPSNARLVLGQDWTAGSLQFAAATTAADGIYFGSDTTLYRVGADHLQTDDRFTLNLATSTTTGLGLQVQGDVQPRLWMRADGTVNWGAGAAPADVTLLRTQIDMLGLPTGDMLDLSAAGGTSIATGTGGAGDKIALYSTTYGIGIQSNRMVFWTTSSGGVAVRADSAVGHHSSGTDAVVMHGTGRITAAGLGKTALELTNTGTTTGITLGGDTTLYRSAANILRTDDLFQVDQTPVTAVLGDFNTYALGLWNGGSGHFGLGSSSASVWMQSFGRPLHINNQGQLVYVDSGLSIAGGLTVTSGTITFPTGSLNGNAIMDGTLPIGAFGFIFGGNNLLYNSGFEAAAVADADPNAPAFQPWDGWFASNCTLSLLTRPVSETRASITLPQATIGIKNAANWTAPGTARIGATTFTFTGITTDLDGLVSLTGCAGGTGTFSANSPITQDPQGVDANRIIGMGNNAVKLTATASGVATYIAPTPTRYVPVEPLKPYTASVYLGAAAAGKNAAVIITWYDATRTATGTDAISAYQAVSSTGMSRLYITGIAPAGAKYARVYPMFQAATTVAGDVYYVDSAMLSDGDMLFAYEPRADEILPGSINATMIQAGAITGDAIVANFSITGKRIQTAPSGQRVVLEGDSGSTLGEAGLGVYNSAGALRVRLGEVTGMTLFSTTGISDPVLKLASTGGLMVGSPTGARTIFDASGVQTYDSTPTLRVKIDAASGLELRDTASNVQVKLSGTGGLQTIGSAGSVFFDSNGLIAYNSTTTFTTATQVVEIDRDTGKLVMGAPTGAFRMEADRTSFRFYDSAGTLGLYTDFGGLRTSSTSDYVTLRGTGLRVVLSNIERVGLGAAGLELKDTAGVARVVLSADGGLKTTGATGTVIFNDGGLQGYNSTATLDATTQYLDIDRATSRLILGNPSARRMEADRTSMRYFNDAGTQTLSIIDGILTTGALDSGVRVRMWAVVSPAMTRLATPDSTCAPLMAMSRFVMTPILHGCGCQIPVA